MTQTNFLFIRSCNGQPNHNAAASSRFRVASAMTPYFVSISGRKNPPQAFDPIAPPKVMILCAPPKFHAPRIIEDLQALFFAACGVTSFKFPSHQRPFYAHQRKFFFYPPSQNQVPHYYDQGFPADPRLIDRSTQQSACGLCPIPRGPPF